MLDPTPITRRFHGSSLAAALLLSAAYFFWPDQSAPLGWVATAYGAVFLASLKTLHAAIAGLQLILHRQLKRRAKQAAQKHHPAKWASDKELQQAGMFEPNGRPLGETLSGIPIFEPATSVHSKIVAPPGMWKTIAAIVTAIMHLAHSSRGKNGLRPSLIIPDVKGELAAMCAEALRALGCEVWVVNDTMHLGMQGIDLNPFALLIEAFENDHPRKKARAGVIARSLAMTIYPDPKDGDEKNRFWRAGARDCLIAATFCLLARKELTPSMLWSLLSDPSAFVRALKTLADMDEVTQHGVLIARSLLETSMEEPQHFADFRSSAAQRLESFEMTGMLAHVGLNSSVSHSAIRKRQVIVFMVSPLAYSDELALLQKLHLQSFLMSLKEEAQGQPVEFILDEACNAKAALSGLIDDLTLVRGLSARVHLVAQAESQVVATWGREAAKTLDAVTDLKQIMGTNSPEEAQVLSKALAMGVIDFEELGFSTKSEDVTLRADRTGRPLMTPDEILSMPRDEQIILVNGLRPIRARKLSYARYAPICDQLQDNPIEGGKLAADPKVFLQYPKPSSENTESEE
jgi:type IV secretion system protein VirD4